MYINTSAKGMDGYTAVLKPKQNRNVLFCQIYPFFPRFIRQKTMAVCLPLTNAVDVHCHLLLRLQLC